MRFISSAGCGLGLTLIVIWMSPLGFLRAPRSAAAQAVAPKPPQEPTETREPIDTPQPTGAEKPVVREIVFPGRQWISRDRLLSASGLNEGELWSETRSAEVLRRLQDWPYLAQVARPREVVLAAGERRIEIVVTERATIGRVDITGFRALEKRTLLPLIDLRTGQPLLEQNVRATVARLTRRYHEDGFLLATITPMEASRGNGLVDLTLRIEEGRRVFIDSIELEGARQISARQALDAMWHRPLRLFGLVAQGYYVPDRLPSDLEALQSYYHRQGYLSARVDLDSVRFDEDGKLHVRLRVREGPRWIVDGVSIAGNSLLPNERLLRELDLPVGEFYSGEAIERGVERLTRWYDEHVDRNPQVDLQPRSVADDRVHLRFVLDEGEQLFTGRVEFTGNTVTRERVLRQQSELTPGQPFTMGALQRTAENLEARGLFRGLEAAIQPDPDNENVRNVRFEVTEKEKWGFYQAGGGAFSGGGALAYGSIRHSNFDLFRLPRQWNDWRGAFVGGGQTLEVEAAPGSRESNYRLRFKEPYFFHNDLSFSLDASAGLFTRRGYDENHGQGMASLRRRLDRQGHLSAAFGWIVDHVDIDPEEDGPAAAFAVEGNTLLAYPRLELRYDATDLNYYSGPAGFRALGFLDVADDVTGSELDFVRGSAQIDWFVPLWDRRPDHRHILHLGLEAGAIRRFDGEAVPIFERFFVGGPYSFPGFRYRHLGPAEGRFPVGGEGLLRGSVSYSLPLGWREFRAFGRFDWGDNAVRASKISTGRFRTALGGGLQVRLRVFGQPVPANFFWMKALSSEAGDREQLFSFNFGYAF